MAFPKRKSLDIPISSHDVLAMQFLQFFNWTYIIVIKIFVFSSFVNTYRFMF